MYVQGACKNLQKGTTHLQFFNPSFWQIYVSAVKLCPFYIPVTTMYN